MGAVVKVDNPSFHGARMVMNITIEKNNRL